MSGRHRKRSQVATTVVKRGGTGLAAAAISATGLSTAVVTGATAAVAPNVQLMALVSAANSTSQFFAGSSYYGTDWTTVYGKQQVVPFLAGPQGLADAIASHKGDASKTGVTASGWGAGQTGEALRLLADNSDDTDLDNVGLVIFDNNTNRAGGGFWTTYDTFAPLLLTSSKPTPTDLPANVTVLDVGYEYNINGDAPVDPLNPFALGNSLLAYAYGYGQESSALDITQDQTSGAVVLHDVNPSNTGITYVAADPDGVKNDIQLEKGKHYVVKDGAVVVYDAPGTMANPNNSTIYVTVDSGELPLTRPLRLLPGGDILADALDPTATALVNAGYADGKGTAADPAIPKDPTVTRPWQPGSSLTHLGGVPSTVGVGATAGATTAFQDIANPANFITKPLGEAAKLPFLSTLTNSSVSQNSLTAKSAAPQAKTASTGSNNAERPRPLKQAADDFNSSLKKFADSLHKKAPASNAEKPDSDGTQ